jgi:hypothetical protein
MQFWRRKGCTVAVKAPCAAAQIGKRIASNLIFNLDVTTCPLKALVALLDPGPKPPGDKRAVFGALYGQRGPSQNARYVLTLLGSRMGNRENSKIPIRDQHCPRRQQTHRSLGQSLFPYRLRSVHRPPAGLLRQPG